MITMVVFAAVSAVLVAGFLLVRLTQKPIYGMLAKLVPSLSFVIMGVVAVVYGTKSGMPYGAAVIVLGLAFGLIGDLFIDMIRVQTELKDHYLFAGMSSFFLGHVVYITAISMVATHIIDGKIWLPAVVSAVIAILATPVIMIASTKLLKAKFGRFYAISAMYAAILVFICCYTIWLTVLNFSFFALSVGTLSFLLSDLVLSQQFFVEGKRDDPSLTVINHALYYSAQILIAAFLYVIIGL